MKQTKAIQIIFINFLRYTHRHYFGGARVCLAPSVLNLATLIFSCFYIENFRYRMNNT